MIDIVWLRRFGWFKSTYHAFPGDIEYVHNVALCALEADRKSKWDKEYHREMPTKGTICVRCRSEYNLMELAE